jgi:hypothetical protein
MNTKIKLMHKMRNTNSIEGCAAADRVEAARKAKFTGSGVVIDHAGLAKDQAGSGGGGRR